MKEENTRNKKYTYEDFLEIVKILRSENGCPWDRQQTHLSLRPCIMEEAAEVVAAIRKYQQTGEYENLREELGDVLLQVVMHSQIAKEEGLFTIEDVIQEVASKMVHRHPHVFGDAVVDNAGQVLENWEEIKQKEKEKTLAAQFPLHEVPKELPALTRACKVLKKADKLYQPQDTYQQAVEKLKQAAAQLEQLSCSDYNSQVEMQVGECLMAISNISRCCKLSQEQILSDCIEDIVEQLEPLK